MLLMTRKGRVLAKKARAFNTIQGEIVALSSASGSRKQKILERETSLRGQPRARLQPARFMSSHGEANDDSGSKSGGTANNKNKLVLFDMEGTIGNMVKKKFFPRPGIQELTTLKAEGYRVGLYTNKAARNLPRSVIEAFAGLQFDVVLTGENCTYAPEDYCKAEGISKHSMIKPLATVCENLNDLLLVDDTPAKVAPHERHRVVPIKTWNRAEENDNALQTVVRDILDNWNDRTSQTKPTTTAEKQEKE